MRALSSSITPQRLRRAAANPASLRRLRRGGALFAAWIVLMVWAQALNALADNAQAAPLALVLRLAATLVPLAVIVWWVKRARARRPGA
jgi:hypothetical protein